MKNQIKITAGLALFLLTPACQTLGADQGELALLTAPTPEARAEIKAIVQETLFFVGCINIAANAFVNEPVLAMKSEGARYANTTQTGEPEYSERFTMKTYKGKCYLTYDSTGESTLLKQAQCVPVTAPK